MEEEEKWGYLRENKEKAIKAGIDPTTKLHRTGLEDYLNEIFPHINDWIHDEKLPKDIVKKYKIGRLRPDYRSETLKIIIEFDGIDHYRSPFQIKKDTLNTNLYNKIGYKVIRIPFFIQLSKSAIKELFGVGMEKEMFNEKDYPSFSVDSKCTPACFCSAGIKRMAKDFLNFPVQYRVNLDQLKKDNDDYLTGVSELEKEYNELIKSISS